MRTQITTAAPSSPQAPISLLHRIANDEEFRARLEADPVAVFAEVGVELDPSMVPSKVEIAVSSVGGDPLSDLSRKGDIGGDNWASLFY
ncbi:MAG: hypothetical protein AAGC60_29555 [Acidobacteriota bacterium]